MPLKRTKHWATRELHDFLMSARNKPFAWGTHDCCLFPADAILAFTGIDLAADFRGKYSTEVEAFALIASVTGGKTVSNAAAWCAEKHGLIERADPRTGKACPLMAQRGDLVVMTERDGAPPIAGIVHLTGRHVVTVGQDGLKKIVIQRVTRAWAV